MDMYYGRKKVYGEGNYTRYYTRSKMQRKTKDQLSWQHHGVKGHCLLRPAKDIVFCLWQASADNGDRLIMKRWTLGSRTTEEQQQHGPLWLERTLVCLLSLLHYTWRRRFPHRQRGPLRGSSCFELASGNPIKLAYDPRCRMADPIVAAHLTD